MTEGVERITRRILGDAREIADAILAEATEKAARILAGSETAADDIRKRILEQAGREAEEQKRRIVGVAMLDARKNLLAAKQELIEQSFRQSLHDLANLEDGTYFAFIKEMLLAQVETGSETVILSPRDRERIPPGFWQGINQALLAAGKKGELTLSPEAREMQGGFILESDGVEMNCSLKSMLEIQRDELVPTIAGALFA